MKERPALVHRKKVLFHRNNARPQTAKLVTEKIKEFNCEFMLHPPYFPDLAAFIYYLFRGLESFFRKKIQLNRGPEKDIVRVFCFQTQVF